MNANGGVASPELPSLDVNEENPWVGLHEFTESIHQFFNGRGEETETLARMVRRKGLTVLFGQSGLGKSSLLQAGLFTQLRSEAYLPVYVRLSYTEEQGKSLPALGEQVKNFIAAAVKAAMEKGWQAVPGHSPEPRADETLWEYLHRRVPPLHDAQGNPVSPVLAFDQFEEIFTLGRTSQVMQTGGRSFLKELADCIENRIPKEIAERLGAQNERDGLDQLDFSQHGYRVVIALREDYVAYLDDLCGLIPSVMENRMRLLPLNGKQALQAVLNPARIRKDAHIVGPSVARRIVRFVAASKRNEFSAEGNGEVSEELDMEELQVDPALLSMVCRELNKKRIAAQQAEITAGLVKETNKTILADFYADCFKDPEMKPAQKFVEDNLLTAADFRDSVEIERAKGELSRLGVGSPARTIERLVNQRLLRVIERRSDTEPERLELAHDVLTGVVSESRRQRHRDEQQEAEERARREQAALVLRESEQRRLEAEARARESEANRAATLRQLRQARVRQIIAVSLLAVALAGLGWGWMAQRKLQENDRRASAENFDFALKKAGTFIGPSGDSFGRDPTDFDKLLSLPQYSLADPRGNSYALTHLARALELNPGNIPAATLACNLLLKTRWCPPLTPLMGDAESQRDAQKVMLTPSWTPNGSLVVVTKDARLLGYDGAKGALKTLQTLDAPKPLACASFSQRGNWLFTAGKGANGGVQGMLWTWNEKTGTYETLAADKEPIALAQEDIPRYIAWSPDGRMLLVITVANRSFLLKRGMDGTGALERQAISTDVTGSGITSADFSADSKLIGVATLDSSVRLWRAGDLTGAAPAPVDVRELRTDEGIKERVMALAFNPDPAKDEYLTLTVESSLRVWKRGDPLPVCLPPERQRRERILRALYSPDGKWIISSTSGLAQIWDANDFVKDASPASDSAPPSQRPGRRGILKAVCEPVFHEGGFISSMAFNPGPGRQQFFTAGGPAFNRPDTVRIWDAPLRLPDSQALNLAGDAPAWLPRLAQAVSGQWLTSLGYQSTPAENTLAEVQKEFSTARSNEGYSRVARSFFSVYGEK